MTHNTSNNNDDGSELRDDDEYAYRALDGYSSDDAAAVSATDPDHFADDLINNRKDLSGAYDDTGDQNDYTGGLYNSNTAADEDDEAEVGVLGHPGIDDDTA